MKTYSYPISVFKVMVFLLLVSCAISGYAQKFQFEGKRKRYTIGFQTAQNLIIIPVFVNGKGPFNFLLDTGVSQMIITDTAVLRGYQVKRFSKVKLHGYGFGEDVDAILTRDIDASIGRSAISKIPTAIFTEDLFNLSNYLGVKIYGIIGYYFFNSFLVRINYDRHKITFYDRSANIKTKGARIPIQVRNGKPYINALINTGDTGEQEMELLVDNGSSHPMMLESINQQPIPLPAITIPANLGVGINGAINGAMGRVESLKLGAYTFKNILSGFPQFNPEVIRSEGSTRNGTLGAEILKNFKVTFDYQGEAMYLQKMHSGEVKFDHDMSGMEVYMIGDKRPRYFIGRIEPGSPAEYVGLKTDDELLTLDFNETSYFTLSEITERLKSGDGKQVVVQVFRGKQQYLLLLKLKKRI